jgi:hypothetical protein
MASPANREVGSCEAEQMHRVAMELERSKEGSPRLPALACPYASSDPAEGRSRGAWDWWITTMWAWLILVLTMYLMPAILDFSNASGLGR